MRKLRAQATSTPSDTVGGEVTEGDTATPALETTTDTPADDRLATEQELAPDPGETKQPH
jgi:hypothetical protein